MCVLRVSARGAGDTAQATRGRLFPVCGNYQRLICQRFCPPSAGLARAHLQDQGLAVRVDRLLEGRADGEEAGVRAGLDASIRLCVSEPLAGRQRPVAGSSVLHLPAALHPPLLPRGTCAEIPGEMSGDPSKDVLLFVPTDRSPHTRHAQLLAHAPRHTPRHTRRLRAGDDTGAPADDRQRRQDMLSTTVSSRLCDAAPSHSPCVHQPRGAAVTHRRRTSPRRTRRRRLLPRGRAAGRRSKCASFSHSAINVSIHTHNPGCCRRQHCPREGRTLVHAERTRVSYGPALSQRHLANHISSCSATASHCHKRSLHSRCSHT